MNQNPATQRFEILNIEFHQYVEKLRREWKIKNRSYPSKVYETMNSKEQAEVHNKILAWREYITPIAEAWWKERGFELFWPDDDNQPCTLIPSSEALQTKLMRLDFPTIDLYFVYCLTFCKLTVYEHDKMFAKKLLEMSGLEICKKSDSNEWQDIDQKVLLTLIKEYIADNLDEIIDNLIPSHEKVVSDFKKQLGLKN